MNMNAERVELLSAFLVEDKERAYRLLEMEAEEATAEINANGYDFTVEEIQEYGKKLVSVMNREGELTEESLENVAGGFAIEAAILAAGVTLFVAGLSASVAIGVAIANKKGW